MITERKLNKLMQLIDWWGALGVDVQLMVSEERFGEYKVHTVFIEKNGKRSSHRLAAQYNEI